MSDQVERVMLSVAKWAAGAAISIIVWLGGATLTDIKDGQRQTLKAQTDMQVNMAAIKEQLGARSVDSLHQAAQIEDLRTQVIDIRMRLNTIEQREAKR